MLRVSSKSRNSVIVRCDKSSTLYVPYIEKYMSAVCGNVPERVREFCVRDMVVPPYDQQVSIVAELQKLREIMPLDSSAEGAILLLMRDGKEETLGDLLKTLGEYHDALNVIREVVTETFNGVL